MTKPVIYVDMDGVIADFDGGISRLGFEPDPTFKNSPHGMMDEPGDFKDRMYRTIEGTDFYENLPLMRGAVQLWQTIRHLKPIVLTAAPKFNQVEEHNYLEGQHFQGAMYAKRRWLEDLFLPQVYSEYPIRDLVKAEAGPDGLAMRNFDEKWSVISSFRLPDEQFICTTSARKWQFMNRRHGTHQILIDDRTQNCKDWADHGGTAICHDALESTLERLQELIGDWL